MTLYNLTEDAVARLIGALAHEPTQANAALALILAAQCSEARRNLIHYADVIERARAEYARTSYDELEIDDEPILSVADDGVWVNAWVWINTEEDEENK
jgi:hypothetical protein